MQESKFVPGEVSSNSVESGANVGEVPTESPEVPLPPEKAFANPEKTSITSPPTEQPNPISDEAEAKAVENTNAVDRTAETNSNSSSDGNLETAIAAQAQLEAGLNNNESDPQGSG